MKKLINRPSDVVEEMTQGLLAAYPGLARLAHHTVLLRLDAEQVSDSQVALISGGGSGHEPAHAGYVGAGMLSAAVAGEVFTSPAVDSVLAAIRAVAGKPGVLLIVKNYTGDRMNFGLAAEIARSEGIPVEMVLVADDVALANTEQHAGRRGIAGTVLVHKIAGAAAAEGKSLAEVAAIARGAAQDTATMGVSLSACTVPAIGKPGFVLEDSEVELGLGIHGEPGISRISLESADQLADRLVESILSAHRLSPGERIAVLINNLGSTPVMELAIFGRRALLGLESRGVVIERVYSGTFMSSLDMAGVSLSVLRADGDRLRWLDAPTSAPAWPPASTERPKPLQDRIVHTEPFKPIPHRDWPYTGPTKLEKALEGVCSAVILSRKRLTELDQAVGDGDLGISLSRGARAIQTVLPIYTIFDPAEALKTVALTLQKEIGGSSGPLYGVLLLRAAHVLRSGNADDPQSWAKACIEGCQAVSELGGAELGDRTMLDALIPFAQTFNAGLKEGAPLNDALERAVSAAEEAAKATARMIPRRGRSSYLGERALGHPDPGAIAVAIWLRALISAVQLD